MKLIDKYLNVLFESRQNVEFIFWWEIFFVFVHAVVLVDAVVFVDAVGFIDPLMSFGFPFKQRVLWIKHKRRGFYISINVHIKFLFPPIGKFIFLLRV